MLFWTQLYYIMIGVAQSIFSKSRLFFMVSLEFKGTNKDLK